MPLTRAQKQKLKDFLMAQLGKPYLYGAVAYGLDPIATIFWDCSELTRFAFKHIKVFCPDGSENQYQASTAISNPDVGDLGFIRKPEKKCTHVVIRFNDHDVIEARGKPYNCVIFRPIKKWEAYKHFTGWRRLKVLTNLPPSPTDWQVRRSI